MFMCQANAIFKHEDILKEYPCLEKYHPYFLFEQEIYKYQSEDKSRILLEVVLHTYDVIAFVIDAKTNSIVFKCDLHDGSQNYLSWIYSVGNVFVNFMTVHYEYIFDCNYLKMLGIDKSYKRVNFDREDMTSIVKITYLRTRLAKLI